MIRRPLFPLVVSALSVGLLLAGCASTPHTLHPAARPPTELYAGQPQAVHATEFPVASLAEGVQRGDAAWREGKLELAVYLYVQALQFAPGDAATLRKIGAIQESLGNRGLARRAFEMAVTSGGPDAATLERLGMLYIQDGENANAQKLLVHAIVLDARRWRAHDGLGVLADRRGDYAEARTHYDTALRLEPKAASVFNNRGYSKFLAGDLPGAEADLKESISLGAVPLAWVNLGKVQAKSRRYGAAFKSFLNTLDTARAYNAVGEGAMSNGDHQIAKTYFENAANAAPSYFEDAYKNLALANEALAGRGAGQGT